MATITLIPKDDEGDTILDELEERIGLEPDDTGDDDERIYAIEDDEERVEIVDTLDDIDVDWATHLTLRSRA
jgi:hypothetical protein